MSAALLLCDSWQPTVLQLMPFSSNNASQRQCFTSCSDVARTDDQPSRGFPTLAVTRSRKQKDGRPPRVLSERMTRSQALSEITGPSSQRARSEYCSRVKGVVLTPEDTYLANAVGRTINRSPERSDSPDSSERVPGGDFQRNIKQLLPKPSPCMPYDGRYFQPQNGFWRSVTMTPGEADLQKHRESFVKDVNRSKKKYKLNVNQLPRSTTPIRDNDPDKLNMKQVIRFLQTREDDTPERAPSTAKQERRVKSGYPSATPFKVLVRNPTEADDSERPLPSNREATAPNGSNALSSPVIKKRSHKPPREDVISKSYSDSQSFKTTREFRLHRFLTMTTSYGDVSNNVNPSKKIHPISSAQKRLIITDGSKCLDSNNTAPKTVMGPVIHYASSRHAERYSKFHYRLSRRRAKTGYFVSNNGQVYNGEGDTPDLSKEGVIRLPSMLDFNCESDNDDEEALRARMRVRELKCTSESSECLSIEANARCSDSPSSVKDWHSDSDSSGRLPSRKVTISLPREITREPVPEKRTPDPIRLVMRQNGNLTREKTYMSDIVKHRDGSDRGTPMPFSSRVEFDNRFAVE